MRDTTLLIETDNGFQELDIYEDIPISISYQELTVGDVEERTAPYSLTFAIPATGNNSVIFEHFFEINGTDFNPLNDRRCVVQVRGTDVFRGFLRLNAVTNYTYYQEYEVYITSQVADLSSILSSNTLNDYDWSSYSHDLSYSSVTESWKANTYNTDGLFSGDILYPLVHYGLDYISGTTTPTFTFSMDNDVVNGSMTYIGNPVSPLYFKPAIRLKALVDKIFSETEYNYQSEFFESDYFRSLYMDLAQNGEIGPVLPSGVTSANIFRVYSNGTLAFPYNNVQQQQMRFLGYQTNGYDPLNNYKLYNTTSSSNYFKVPYTGIYYFNVRFNYELYDLSSSLPCYFRFRARKASSIGGLDAGTIVYQTPGTGYAAVQVDQEANIFFSASCQAGEYIRPYIFIENTGGNPYGGVFLRPYQGLTINDPAVMFELYNGPFLTTGTTIDLGLQMPNTTSIDFMKGLVNQFNLVITNADSDKTFTIEPLNWYFNEDDRQEWNFNQYLDLNSPIRIEPLNFDLAKQINFRGQYERDEYYNRLYFDNNKLVFGENRFITPYSIPTGEQDIETPFSPTPTDFISGSTNVVIPMLYKLGDNNTQLPYSNVNHIFFWVGNRFFWKNQGSTSNSNKRYWYLLSGGTPVQQTTYPCVSHFSDVDQINAALVSDINFYASTDFYYANNTQKKLVEYSQNTSYNQFWRTHIDNLYSPESRRLTGQFIMSPEMYSRIKLTDKIYIKDASYRIDKIPNANLVSTELTEISLIKDIYPYYKVELPAPPFTITPNSPYPSPPAPTLYPIEVYADDDLYFVCNRDATIENWYSTSSSGLVGGAIIYQDSGGTTLAPTGWYLKKVTGVSNPYVIGSYGEANPTSC